MHVIDAPRPRSRCVIKRRAFLPGMQTHVPVRYLANEQFVPTRNGEQTKTRQKEHLPARIDDFRANGQRRPRMASRERHQLLNSMVA